MDYALALCIESTDLQTFANLQMYKWPSTLIRAKNAEGSLPSVHDSSALWPSMDEPFRITQLPHVQELLAPFLLENVACTGAEVRLIDCQLFTGTRLEPDYRFDYRYSTIQDPADGCDPHGPKYAFVACGTLAQPSPGLRRFLTFCDLHVFETGIRSLQLPRF